MLLAGPRYFYNSVDPLSRREAAGGFPSSDVKIHVKFPAPVPNSLSFLPQFDSTANTATPSPIPLDQDEPAGLYD